MLLAAEDEKTVVPLSLLPAPIWRALVDGFFLETQVGIGGSQVAGSLSSLYLLLLLLDSSPCTFDPSLSFLQLGLSSKRAIAHC